MEEDEECQELYCSVCIQSYSDHRIPRNLICGHSVCTSCLDLLMRDENRCPECRTYFTETTPSDLPINHPLLRMSRIITYAKTDPNVYPELRFPLTTPSSELRLNAGKCNFHGSTMFFMCITCNVWVCRVCVDVQHPDPPRGKCFIVSAEDAVKKMKCVHKSSLETYIDEADVMRDKLRLDIGSLEVAAEYLKIQNNSCDSGCTADILSFENHSKILEDTIVALNSIQDDMEKAKNEILDYNTPQEIEEPIKLSNKSQVSFENLLEEDKKRELPDFTLKKLLRGKDLKDLLKEERPVYVRRYTNPINWTKIVLKNDKIHLHALRIGCPPKGGISLPYDSVRVLVPKESPILFMEVGWGQEVRGVIYIRMYGNTARSRNAIFLCSGERESSYRLASFLRVLKEGTTHCLLQGGDFEFNNGYEALPVVDDITYSPDYVHELKAGLFCGTSEADKYHLGLFSVCVTDGQQGEKISSAFGFVEEGLDTLKEISLLPNVKDASVMDCGLIIPMC